MRTPSLRDGHVLPALSLLALAAAGGWATTRAPAFAQQRAAEPSASNGAPARLAPAVLPTCASAGSAPVGSVTHGTQRGEAGRAFRLAAQRGLDFVSREAVAWQQQHNCYGCHVQAVTLDALLVGRSHQYDVNDEHLTTLVAGMTTVHGGSRNDRDRLFSTAQAFSGATFARYDQLQGPALREDLLVMANRLVTHQQSDGHVRSDDTRFPVEAGDMQATTQAVQTWRQVYDRTADERWLEPLRRAEGYLQEQASRIVSGQASTVVDLNYAVMGLAAAGAGPQEQRNRALHAQLRARQNEDGGWGFRPGEPSHAFATGQTLYALRLLGADDNDGPVARGMGWLVEHQGEDGSWSHTGSGKAEAMWSVLGLVSLDLLSVSVAGLAPGQHLSAPATLRVSAQDNGGHALRQIDVFVDDVPVHRGCGAGTEYALDPARLGLAAGAHTVDVVATNAQGRTSRRRLELYTGEHYLVEPAARFESAQTLLSWRDIAPTSRAHQVRVLVFRARDERGRAVREAEVRRVDLPGAQGPMRFAFDGRDAQGAALANGRYIAELQWLEPGSARVAQRVELPFVHDTPEAQRANFAEVAGRVNLGGDEHAAPNAAAANATVQLLNARGEVVQEVLTTREGQYRFRSVAGGNYSVRVQRRGFAPAAAPVRAAAAQEAQADMTLR